QSIMQSATAPAFPESKWTSILAGKPIDLDKVLTSLFFLGRDDKHIKKIRDFELMHPRLIPLKRIWTKGKWYHIWNITVEAISFAFPHCHAKLLKYGQYISEVFSSIRESHQ
ncbi:hypothetical protein CERSUDRAFT_59228, partial [Gelatoporia subvermispora B]